MWLKGRNGDHGVDGAKGDKGDVGLEGQKGNQVRWTNQHLTHQDPLHFLEHSDDIMVFVFVFHLFCLFYFFPQGDRGESGLPGDKGEKGEKVQEVIISCSCPTLFPRACD